MRAWLLANCRAKSTKDSYYWYQHHFEQFATREQLEWNENTVSLFLTHWFKKRRSYSACKTAKFAIGALFTDNNIQCNLNTMRMRNLMRAFEKHSNIPSNKRRDPFPVHLLGQLCTKKPASWSIAKWHASCALIAIGLRTMARGSELCSLSFKDIEFVDNKTMIVKFPRTKTQTFGRKVTIKASGKATCPVKLMQRWMKSVVNKERQLFHFDNSVLSVPRITVLLQQIAVLFQCNKHFSSHSLRIGGASALTFAGYTKEQIMAIGDWRSDAIDRYLKESIDHHMHVTADMLL